MRIESSQQQAVGAETADERKLKKACCDLEAVFLNYLLKSMRKTIPKADLFGSARDEEFFRDMMDVEICSAASRTQSLGIADMLYRQLSAGLDERSASGGTDRAGAEDSNTQIVPQLPRTEE
jgi:flagellar protein FlgJ